MLINVNAYVKQLIQMDKFLRATGNQYKFVGSRKYVDRKGRLPNGYTATLMIIKDTHDYGTNKDGTPRDNNELRTFDVTILDGTDGTQFKKGQLVKLGGFREDASYFIDYNLILRFDSMEAVNAVNDKRNGN